MESIEKVGASSMTVASISGPDVSIPGPDDEIELDQVERELAALWAAAAPEDPGAAGAREAGDAVLRACALNLLVLAHSRADRDRIRAVADQTTLAHPSRILLLAPEGAPDPPSPGGGGLSGTGGAGACGIGAQISTFCHRPGDGRRHVCCEEITLRARGSAAARLPEAVLPLLLPDLPVYLWLPDSSRCDTATLERLVALADQVIWSARCPADRLPDHSTGARQPIGLDLDWARLLPWRELTAQLFDGPERRARLERLEAVEAVVHGPPVDRPGAGWLWIGWLASRLGWVIGGKADGPATLRLAGEGGPISVGVRPHETERVPGGELCTVRLRVRGCPEPLELERLLPEESGSLSIHASTGRCVHLGTCDEAALLGEALNGAGQDRVYEEAWEMGVRLWDHVTSDE